MISRLKTLAVISTLVSIASASQTCAEGKIALHDGGGNCDGGSVDASGTPSCNGDSCVADDFANAAAPCCATPQTCAAGKSALHDGEGDCDGGSVDASGTPSCNADLCVADDFANAAAPCCTAAAACSTISSDSSFCGSGKVYDSTKDHTACAGSTCSSTDVATCCKNAPQTCAAGKTALGDDGSCDGGSVAVADASAQCPANPCVADDFADASASCCTAAAACSTISSDSSFCGSGKVYDSTKDHTACAGSTCSSSTDVVNCWTTFTINY